MVKRVISLGSLLDGDTVVASVTREYVRETECWTASCSDVFVGMLVTAIRLLFGGLEGTLGVGASFAAPRREVTMVCCICRLL